MSFLYPFVLLLHQHGHPIPMPCTPDTSTWAGAAPLQAVHPELYRAVEELAQMETAP